MTRNTSYDCIIIGGGPAGATAGTLLAAKGRRVLILEKDAFPRHHIGESLMPHTYHTFRRLGMLEKLAASDFPRKESVQFISGSGQESQPFFFPDWNPHESSTTWQVPRDRFDGMMLENAEEHGAEVRQGVRVLEVLFEGERAVGVRIAANGESVDLAARVVIDASGQSAIISRQLGLRSGDHRLKNGAIYAYYRGALRDEGRNAGATLVIHTPDRTGWFWFIPLPDDVASVGLVAPPQYLFTGRGDDPLATLEAEIAACPGMARRMESAERISKAYVTSDFTYRSRRIAGDGWVLIGDAYGFLDPIYSSGVMLALKSGELAADTVDEALATDDPSGERLQRFGPGFVAGMESLRKLVYAFYDPRFSFGKFISAHPRYKDHLIRMLIGDVFNDEVGEMFEAMRGHVALPDDVEPRMEATRS